FVIHNITTEKVPHLHFHQSLRVAHHDLVNFTCLPRFGCKAYRTLNKPEKGGKFDPRAQVGWFVGFQSNTTKNALILSPYKTPNSRWTWKVFCTPHAAFDENAILGLSNPAATTNDLNPARTDSHSNCTSEFSPPPATPISEVFPSDGNLEEAPPHQQGEPEKDDPHNSEEDKTSYDTLIQPSQPPTYAGHKRNRSLGPSSSSSSSSHEITPV
ncbi:hypothetical protein K3495_g12375, partial [Podosphaera aphanis]